MRNEDQIAYLCAYSSLRQQLLVETPAAKWFQNEGWLRMQFDWQLMNRNGSMDLSVGAVDQQLNPQ